MNEFDKKIQELDEQLAKLKALDIKEISQTTRLTTNKIQDILEKRFDNIDRMRAKGFLTILEREYKMDLSMWLEEYTRYFVGGVSAPSSSNATPEVAALKIKNVDSESSKKGEQEPQAQVEKADEKKLNSQNLNSQKLDSQKDSSKLDSENAASAASGQVQQAQDVQTAENAQPASQPSNSQPSKENTAPKSVQSLKLPKEGQKQNSEFKKDDGKSAQNILIYVVLIAVTAAVVAYFGLRMFGGNTKNATKQNVPATAQTAQSGAQAPVIVEQKVDDGAYDGIFIDADSVNGAVSIMSVINSKEAIDKGGEQSDDSVSLDSQNADSQGLNSENVAQNATAKQSENVAQNVDSQNVARNESIFPQKNVAPQKFIVTPNSELWVGVIDVQTQRSTQRNIRTTSEFELDKPQIFVFGHGDFKASVDGDPAPHRSKQFVRFYFDGQKIEEINYTRYKQLFPNERW